MSLNHTCNMRSVPNYEHYFVSGRHNKKNWPWPVNKNDFCTKLLSCDFVATVQSMPEHFPPYMAVLLSVGTLLPFIRHCTIQVVDTRGVPSSSNSFWIPNGQERLVTTTSMRSNSFKPVNTNIKILSLHHHIMY
jgi:hypothetical protein